MGILEILLISIGLSFDVFVVHICVGAGFSRKHGKDTLLSSLIIGGMQLFALILGNVVADILKPDRKMNETISTAASGWELLSVLIFIGLGIYMICKARNNKQIFERRNDEINWKRLRKREQETLQKLQAESQMHYAALAKQPFVYGQNLSGNVTLDAVVADYAKRAQARALLFEAVVEPLQCTDKAELDVTVIVDAMLETAFAGVVEEADAFVQLTVSERKGSLFLDVDYVTGKRVPHKKEQALADALIGKYDGSKQLRKKGRERQICVLLPQSTVRR